MNNQELKEMLSMYFRIIRAAAQGHFPITREL